jgi:hypothetical protein
MLDILAAMADDWSDTSAALMDHIAAAMLVKYGDRAARITIDEMRDVIARFVISREVTSDGPGMVSWSVMLTDRVNAQQMELPLGSKLNPGRFDCYSRARPDEPMFVLLARDPSAPYIVDQWAKQRLFDIQRGIKPESDKAKVNEAIECAERMRAWYYDNPDNKDEADGQEDTVGNAGQDG